MAASSWRIFKGMTALCGMTALAVTLVGCGPAEPFTHAQISGKVTYEDGTPIQAHRVRIQFLPQAAPVDQKTHPRVGVAELEPDGSFSNVTSHKYGDGVVIGKHKVTLTPLDKDERELKVIPEKYMRADTTDLEIDTADYSSDNPYHLKVPKPAGVK